MSPREAAELAIDIHYDLDRIIAGGCALDDEEWAVLHAMYDAEIAYTDHMVGRLIEHLRSLDLGDWDSEGLLLHVRHQPESETPLKNGTEAERAIAVGEHYAEVIDDYVRINRDDVRDEYGREPLVTTQQGRISNGTIRETVYRVTRPCIVGRECPHGRDESECEALESYQSSKCPSSRSPHTIRRGAITRMLRKGVPEEVVSDRSNATPDVLEQHYDQRSERERAERRREFLDDV
jgi:integrase